MIELRIDLVTRPDTRAKTVRRALQGHPPELSDSVKLLLSDAKRYGFEFDHVLKSID